MRSPVLEKPVIEVREQQRLLEEERRAIERDEGAGAIREVPGHVEGTTEYWVRWHEVQDFLNSGPLDRHYVLDHIRGEIGFGDSRRGMIPPVGVGNMVATTYGQVEGVPGTVLRGPSTLSSHDSLCRARDQLRSRRGRRGRGGGKPDSGARTRVSAASRGAMTHRTSKI